MGTYWANKKIDNHYDKKKAQKVKVEKQQKAQARWEKLVKEAKQKAQERQKELAKEAREAKAHLLADKR